MEKIEAKKRSPRGPLPRQKNQNPGEKTLGKKRPRRSNSSSPKNTRDAESIDQKNVNVSNDSKMNTSTIPGKSSATTNLKQIKQNEKEPIAADGHSQSNKNYSVLPVSAAIGVTLPWFETGGPMYQRPPSLLWDAPKDVDRTRKGERKRKRTAPFQERMGGSNIAKHHFCGFPIPSKRLGVCAECGIDEQGVNGVTTEAGNVVVLCDGPGCDREFHLKCCRPPLQHVPEGDFYCFDCHPNGGYAVTLLEDYLDEIEAKRDLHNAELLFFEEESSSCHDTTDKNANTPLDTKSGKNSTSLVTPNRRTRRTPKGKKDLASLNSESNYNYNDNGTGSSRRERKNISDTFSFVDKLLYEDMVENQPTFLPQLMDSFCVDAEGKGPPRSELDFFHRDKDLLVGCALRLYCPKTNQYQTGRILKFREAPQNNDPNNLVIEDYDRLHDTECLVRFGAGRDYRKKTATRWLRLEEHSLAVASPHLVWGKFASSELGSSSSSSSPNNKKTKGRWVPTKLWLRSSRELVMSMQLLDESLRQISYRGFRKHASSIPVTANDESDSVCLSPNQQRSQERKNGQKRIDGLVHGDSGTHNTRINGASRINASKCSFESKSYLQQEWILAECVGREIYKLLHVTSETQDYCCTALAPSKGLTSTGKNGISNKKSPTKTNATSQNLSVKRRENEIMFALVQAEHEERNRILLWNKLPLQNVWHEKAMTSLDEDSLGPLVYDGAYKQPNLYQTSDNGECEIRDEEKAEGTDKNSFQRSILIEPSPLVRTGLDRMYILEQFVTHYNQVQEANGIFFNTKDDMVRGTKDLAMSLSSELVNNHTITACIQQQNRLARLRQEEEIREQQKGISEKSPSLPVSASNLIHANSTVTTEEENANLEQETTADVLNNKDENSKRDAIETPVATENILSRLSPNHLVATQNSSSSSKSPTSSTGIPLLVPNESTRKIDLSGDIKSHTDLDDVIDVVDEASSNEKADDINSISSSIRSKKAKRKRTMPSRILPGSSLMPEITSSTQQSHQQLSSDNVSMDEMQSTDHNAGETTNGSKAYNINSISRPAINLHSHGVPLSMSKVFENLHEQGEA